MSNIEEISSVRHAPCGALELLLAAFEGAPHPGTRELRLSDEECSTLRQLFPTAEFAPLEGCGERRWYAVTLPQ